LFYLAREARPSWRKPSDTTKDFIFPRTGDPYIDHGNGHTNWREEPAAEEENFNAGDWHDARGQKESTHNNGLRLVRFDDMRPQVGGGYLVKQLLSSTAMTVIYGEAGTGKTFFALWLALRIASGDEFFGRRVRCGAVLYIAAEAGRSIENRVAAAKNEFEFPS
jgi:hypothetical protein